MAAAAADPDPSGRAEVFGSGGIITAGIGLGIDTTHYGPDGLHVDSAHRDTDLLHSAYVGELETGLDNPRLHAPIGRGSLP